MKKLLLAAVAAASLIPAAAMAQDTAPDGTPAFGIEPYVGIMGGYHNFDGNKKDLVQDYGPKGALIQGVAGVNVPLGAFFVGAEGNVAKGFNDIDWEYGVVGRAGVRVGDSGMIYGKAGYQWVNLDGPGNRNNEIYGAGVEVGPKDIGLGGLTGNSGVRLRMEVDTVDFNSIRPMAGVIMHF
jgi:outer membrane immunogenic protein